MKCLLPIAFLVVLGIGTAMMTGGYSAAKDLNSRELLKFAKFATVAIAASSNSLHHMKLMNITHARTQVVAGVNYDMRIEIGETECKKNKKYENLDECAFIKCKKPLVCDIIVWDRAWIENGTQLTHQECHPGDDPCAEPLDVTQH